MTAPAPVATKTIRLQFVDNIRWAVIVLVIFHHSAVTYSHVGSWYYFETPAPGFVQTLLMATFLAFNQAWFMGFLFLIAAYFAAASLDRKGARRFIWDRAARLGLPSLLFMLVIDPVTVYWLLRDFHDPKRPSLAQAYGPFLSSGRVLDASGPMWFALALLLFCLVYAVIRMVRPAGRRDLSHEKNYHLPTHGQVVLIALFILAATFLVRIVQPVGTSVFNMQLCYFVQYIVLFGVGILAYRKNWLLRIPFAFGIAWLRFALTGGVLLWLLVLAASGVSKNQPPTAIFGGVHWQSALYCLWESFFCVGMCLGILVLFRDRIRVANRFAGFMSRNAFSAYVFHTPLLIAVTLAMHPIPALPVVKFVLAGALAVIVTFLASEFVFRRTPLLRDIL